MSSLQLWNREQAGCMEDYVAVTDELIENLVRDVEEMERELSWLHALENSGKPVDEVSARYKKRKLAVLRNNAVEARSRTYGLILDTRSLCVHRLEKVLAFHYPTTLPRKLNWKKRKCAKFYTCLTDLVSVTHLTKNYRCNSKAAYLELTKLKLSGLNSTRQLNLFVSLATTDVIGTSKTLFAKRFLGW